MPIASKSGMTPSKCSPYKFGSLVAVSCTTVVVGAHSRRQTGTRLWAAPTSSRLQRAPNHHAHESRSATGGVLEILRQICLRQRKRPNCGCRVYAAPFKSDDVVVSNWMG